MVKSLYPASNRPGLINNYSINSASCANLQWVWLRRITKSSVRSRDFAARLHLLEQYQLAK